MAEAHACGAAREGKQEGMHQLAEGEPDQQQFKSQQVDGQRIAKDHMVAGQRERRGLGNDRHAGHDGQEGQCPAYPVVAGGNELENRAGQSLEQSRRHAGATTLSILSTYFSHLKQKLLHHHTHAKRVYELKHRGVFLMTIAVFLMRVAVSVSGFLLPLYVFEQNKNILEVVLMAIIVSIPVMLTVFFGDWVDRNPLRSFVFSFTILLPVVIGLAMITGYYTTLLLAFSMMMVLEIISIGIQSITTNITPENHYGSVTTLMSATENIGDMMGPLLLGIGMDMLGIKNSLFGLVAILSLFLVMILISKAHLKTEMLMQSN